MLQIVNLVDFSKVPSQVNHVVSESCSCSCSFHQLVSQRWLFTICEAHSPPHANLISFTATKTSPRPTKTTRQAYAPESVCGAATVELQSWSWRQPSCRQLSLLLSPPMDDPLRHCFPVDMFPDTYTSYLDCSSLFGILLLLSPPAAAAACMFWFCWILSSHALY